MKIIFLDIDGVLNPTSYESFLTKLWKLNPLRKSRDQFGSYFAPWCVDALREIINKTGAEIVISSTWRMSGLEVMKEMWTERGLPGKIISITPFNYTKSYSGLYIQGESSDTLYSCRGDEIRAWLATDGFLVQSYVIIDDVPVEEDFLEHQIPNFIKTSSIDGLTEEHVEQCVKILNKSN